MEKCKYSSKLSYIASRWRWSASGPGRFTPADRGTYTHWICGWGGIQSRSGCGGEGKHPCFCRESNSGRPVPSL